MCGAGHGGKKKKKKMKGPQALIKRVSPNAQWTHCVKRGEAPAAGQMSPGLKEVLTDFISVISFIQNRALKVRPFPRAVRGDGSRTLSCAVTQRSSVAARAKLLWRVFERRRENSSVPGGESMNESLLMSIL